MKIEVNDGTRFAAEMTASGICYVSMPLYVEIIDGELRIKIGEPGRLYEFKQSGPGSLICDTRRA